MKNIFLIQVLLCVVSVLGLASCDDDNLDPNTFEGAASKYEGRYNLSSVIWSGDSVDFDYDGVGRCSILEEEFGKLEGYDPTRRVGIVRKNTTKSDTSMPSMRFVAGLPYPVYELKDGKNIITHMEYLTVFLNVHYEGEDKWSAICDIPHNFRTDYFISGIDEIQVKSSSLRPDSFEIQVLCRMINAKNQEEKNYLHYYYKR